MSKFLFCAAAVGLVLLGPAAARDDKAAPKLDGTYTIVAGEEHGKALPEDRVLGSVVTFAGGKITGTDKDKKEFFAASYTLDTSKSPTVIRMKSTAPKEAEATGLVKKERDTVTIIYALPGSPAPTEFNTTKGQQMFVLQPRAKLAK